MRGETISTPGKPEDSVHTDSDENFPLNFQNK